MGRIWNRETKKTNKKAGRHKKTPKEAGGRRENIWIGITSNVIIAVVITAILFGSLAGMGAIMTGGKNKAIYQGNTAENRVSLMVNVYWGTEYIEGMLEVFARYGVKTTFFLGGSWAAANHDMVKKIVEAGHELGNHGYRHKDAKNLTVKQNEDEIIITHKLVEKLTGVKMTLFAPPSGSLGANMFDVCEQNGYKVIMWSKDTIDWRDKNAETVYKRAVTDIQKGDLILMHPTEHTLKALPNILNAYKEKGMLTVPVSENLLPSAA